MKFLYFLLLTSAICLGIACNETPQDTQLPILGERVLSDEGDTIYHQIPDFAFINQDSMIVSSETVSGKIYVADFFFTSCPTICPRVKQQMLKIYNQFEQEADLLLLSHSIDTQRDTVPRLKEYADKLGVVSERWAMLTGDKSAIYEIADDYFSVAIEDEDAPGGFDHSGRLILVDQDGHVRSFCNGTEAEDVDRFMIDIQKLLDEKNPVPAR